MTDDNTDRPRHAMASGDDQVDPVEPDDTPAELTFSGRRGRFDFSQEASQSEDASASARRGGPNEPEVDTDPAADSGPGAEQVASDPAQAPGQTPRPSFEGVFRPGQERPEPTPDEGPDQNTLTMTLPHQHTAFMRPGTAPVVEVEVPLSELAVAPHEGEEGTIDVDDPEVIAAALRAATARAEQEAAEQPIQGVDLGALKGETEDDDAIVAGTPHPTGLNRWAKAGIAAAAVLLVGGGVLTYRSLTTDPGAAATPSASSGKPGSGVPAVITPAMLITPDAAKSALGDQGWEISQTWNPVGDNEPVNISCQSAKQPDLPIASGSMQQGLRSKASSGMAVLQRLDSYATVADAQKAFGLRATALAACSDQPALIDSGASVTGAGDQAVGLRLTYQDPDKKNQHTVIVVRTGLAVSMLDVSNNSAAVQPAAALKALTPTLTAACGPAKGACPKDAAAADTVVPVTPLAGWLAVSDVPQITAGSGNWTPTDAAAVTSKGSLCEQVDLAKAPKATAAQQRTYVLQQDGTAPANFGFDQLRYTFANAADAAAWAKTLTTNIDGCAAKVPNAKVSEATELKTAAQDNAQVTGKTWKIAQDTTGKAVGYRVGVAVVGTQVTYLTISQTDFGFTAADFQSLVTRAGVRASQVK